MLPNAPNIAVNCNESSTISVVRCRCGHWPSAAHVQLCSFGGVNRGGACAPIRTPFGPTWSPIFTTTFKSPACAWTVPGRSCPFIPLDILKSVVH